MLWAGTKQDFQADGKKVKKRMEKQKEEMEIESVGQKN